MNYLNDDGMLIVRGDYGDDLLYFDDWLKVEVGYDLESLRYSLIDEYEGNEDSVEERIDELESKFYDYCDENDLVGETV